MKWDQPQYLYYIFLIPLFFVVSLLLQKAAIKKLKKHFAVSLHYLWENSISWTARYWKWTLRCLTLIFLLIALARPQLGQSEQSIQSEGFEIFLGLDVSESMLAEDIRPSRLEKAKIDLNRLVDNLGGHKIGVLAFAGSAAVISPLTQDIAAVKMYIDSLDTQTISTQGTEFEAAITAAEAAFDRGTSNQDERSGITKVFLIASDGEDHEKGALDKAEALVKKGIRIFTVAYGTEKGGAIPVRDTRGFLKGYKKDRSGQTILTTVKGDALKALAKSGQGFFIFSRADSTFVTEISKELDQLKKTQFESEMQIQYDERFQIPLLLAFIFGLLELFISDRRNRRPL